jgi:DNA invertase Pin-like site-specific DNA recombinase
VSTKKKTAVTDDLRAVGYVRVSTAEQATEDKSSLDQQRERIAAQSPKGATP